MIVTDAPIDQQPPASWQALQKRVARIYRECGWQATVDHPITTVRGGVNVDVFARDPRPSPPVVTLCECKLWKKPVPKTVVHSLRSVAADHGANWGLIISSAGFQKGAREAAVNTNVMLVDWTAFETLMKQQWIETFLVPRLFAACDALVEYTEPINSRIFRKADLLSKAKQQRFRKLREKHTTLAIMLLPLNPVASMLLPNREPIDFVLPLRKRLVGTDPSSVPIPLPVLNARSLRGLLLAYSRAAASATEEFDLLFGGRA